MEIDQLLDEADAALADGQPEEALTLARQAVRQAPDDPDAVFMEAEALLELGEYPAAMARYAAADALLPDSATILAGWGIAAFESVRLPEARARLEAALAATGGADLADVHWYLGLLDERDGQERLAAAHFKRAHKLAPQVYPRAVTIAVADVEAAVERCLDELPDQVREALRNVAVSVEPFPAEADLLAGEPPFSPQLLGLWRGTALPERSFFDPWTQLPGAIVLYQRNLERACRNRAELFEQVRITVWHEVGHALGLDEEQLAARGLD